MTIEWYFGLDNRVQTPEHAARDGQFDDVRQYWIGRSCGCKLRTLEVDAPKNTSGIVVYPGHRFSEEESSTRHIKHINTKSGPLTICSDLSKQRYTGSYGI